MNQAIKRGARVLVLTLAAALLLAALLVSISMVVM